MSAWTIVVVVGLVLAALLLIADALLERGYPARTAGLLALAAGFCFAMDWADPWLPLALVAGAVVAFIFGEKQSRDATAKGASASSKS